MGTRGLTCVVIDGDFKVAQYGQWDHYPTGQGEVIREFFSQPDLDIDKFEANVRACSFLTDAETKKLDNRWSKDMKAYQKLWDDEFNGSHDYEKAREKQQALMLDSKRLCYLSRDVGGRILQCVYVAPRKLQDERTFAGDGLFCEWAYVVDLDTMMLEIYRGFQKTADPTRGRFAKFDDPKSEYRPVRLAKIIPIAELPKIDMAVVEAELNQEEEEPA